MAGTLTITNPLLILTICAKLQLREMQRKRHQGRIVMRHWRAMWLASTCTLVLFATGANATIILEGADFGNTLAGATVVSTLSPDSIAGFVSPTDENDYLKWLGLAAGTNYSFSTFVDPFVQPSFLNSAGVGITSSGLVPN